MEWDKREGHPKKALEKMSLKVANVLNRTLIFSLDLASIHIKKACKSNLELDPYLNLYPHAMW